MTQRISETRTSEMREDEIRRLLRDMVERKKITFDTAQSLMASREVAELMLIAYQHGLDVNKPAPPPVPSIFPGFFDKAAEVAAEPHRMDYLEFAGETEIPTE